MFKSDLTTQTAGFDNLSPFCTVEPASWSLLFFSLKKLEVIERKSLQLWLWEEDQASRSTLTRWRVYTVMEKLTKLQPITFLAIQPVGWKHLQACPSINKWNSDSVCLETVHPAKTVSRQALQFTENCPVCVTLIMVMPSKFTWVPASLGRQLAIDNIPRLGPALWMT